jgi:hypothetical protein
MAAMFPYLPEPNLRRGLHIFASRPFSLVAALILVIVISLGTFMVLTFPTIAAYFYAVRQSRREEYFIDLNSVVRTCGLVFRGIKRYFLQSYLLGIVGLLPPVALLLVPLVPLRPLGPDGRILSLILQVLYIPAFFLAGAVVLYGYPALITTNHAIGSFRRAIVSGRTRLWKVLALGFVLLCPLPGLIVHLLMVLSYPFIVAWAVSATADTTEILIDPGVKEKWTAPGVLVTFTLVAIGVIGGYLLLRLWGGPGLVAAIAVCLAFLLAGVLGTWRFAMGLFGFALGFVAILLGGMLFFSRGWGEGLAFIWVAICVAFLIVFLSLVQRRQ